MNGQKVILGEFESELYAEIAKRELRIAGIRAKIIKNRSGDPLPLFNQNTVVSLMVSDSQIEDAKKILRTKFI